MLKVDSTRCYECGRVEYQVAVGKTSRSFTGICDRCVKEVENEKANVAREVAPGVPKGNQGK